MAADCLLTKLQAAATGSRLQRLGCMYLNAKALDTITSSDQQKLQVQVYPGNTVVVNALDGGYFALTAAGLDNPGDRMTTISLTSTDGLKALYFANATYRVELENKYAINALYPASYYGRNLFSANIEDYGYTRISRVTLLDGDSYGNIESIKNLGLLSVNLRNNKLFGDFSAFAEKTSMQSLSIAGCLDVYGSISSLANLTALTSLALFNSGNVGAIIGSINDLGKLINVTTLDAFRNTSVNGEIITFVTSQIANGRTTRTTSSPLRCDNIIKNCTFNGLIRNIETHSNPTYMTWDSASKITIYDKCVGTNLNNAAVIYALGATAGEISAWETAGKEVIVVD